MVISHAAGVGHRPSATSGRAAGAGPRASVIASRGGQGQRDRNKGDRQKGGDQQQGADRQQGGRRQPEPTGTMADALRRAGFGST